MFIFKALCALAVAFLCANSAKGYYFTTDNMYKVKLASPYPIRDVEQVLYKVECDSKCLIHTIRFSHLKGGLILEAVSDSAYICYSTGQTCNVVKRINDKVFYISLLPNPSFSSGTLIVEMGRSKAKITELNAEGAMRLSQYMIRIKSGYQEPDYRPQRYKIKCNGPCSIYDVGADNDVRVAISKEPVFETDGGGCFNCFCVWAQFRHDPKCYKSGNLGSSTIYVNLIQYRNNFRDAMAYVYGNFKSVELYDNSNRNTAYDYENGYKAVAAVVIGPTNYNKEINFYVWCEDNTACTDIKIEVLTHSRLFAVRAGIDPRLTYRGQCKKCDCTNRRSCLGRFNPSLYGSGVTKMFEINIKLGRSKRTRQAYVRVSGKGLSGIQNNDAAYYNYYY